MPRFDSQVESCTVRETGTSDRFPHRAFRGSNHRQCDLERSMIGVLPAWRQRCVPRVTRRPGWTCAKQQLREATSGQFAAYQSVSRFSPSRMDCVPVMTVAQKGE